MTTALTLEQCESRTRWHLRRMKFGFRPSDVKYYVNQVYFDCKMADRNPVPKKIARDFKMRVIDARDFSGPYSRDFWSSHVRIKI